MPDDVTIHIEYQPDQSVDSFMDGPLDIHPLVLQGGLHIRVNDRVVAGETVALLELLGYCQEWLLLNHGRTHVGPFRYTSMEHEDCPILEIRPVSEKGGGNTVHLFKGPPLAEVGATDVIRLVSKMRGELIGQCLRNPVAIPYLLDELGIDF